NSRCLGRSPSVEKNRMRKMKSHIDYLYISFCLAACSIPQSGHSATVWTGPTTNFVNTAGSDPNLAVNQDRLTPNVWITRDSIQGIYNAKTETTFTHFSSPQDTEWADGILANY